jgi:sulfoxide reductase heme-binding subunit YedZ
MKDASFAKFVVLVNGSVPLGILCWDALRGQLGANPTLFAIRTTGMLTLVFLTLSLAVTPIRLVSGQNWLSNFRRMLGLYAFFYGVFHLSTYFVFDRSLNIASTISDTLARPFIFFGMAALLLMVPLAATSTNAAIKRLGAAKWKRLHQLAYVSGICAVTHYYLLVKADTRLPIAFGITLGLLLAYRVLVKWIPALRYRRSPARA